MRILVALGGSALLKRGETLTPANIQHAVDYAAHELARAVVGGDHLIITHGNGAQLGLLGLDALNSPRELRASLDCLQARTQGWIGYQLELALRNALPQGALVVNVVTQTLVDLHDHAFKSHFAPIGPVFDKETAERLAGELNWRIGPAGRGWCRLVPQPQPVDIIEIEAIRRLANTGVTVVCGGGGGVAVHRDIEGKLHGLEAVVDKDAAAALLAARVEADFFVILTDIGGLYMGYGGPDQRLIASTGAHDLAAHLPSFPEGSIRSKAKAAIDFVHWARKPAAIGKLADFSEILAGRRGTLVSPKGGQISFHDQAAPG